MNRFDDHFASDADEFEAPYEVEDIKAEKSLWASIAKRLVKHLKGEHDQSSHGGNRSAGVPASVDLEGKRFSNEAIVDFTNRKVAFENAADAKFQEIKNEAALALTGEPLESLDSNAASKLSDQAKLVDGEWVQRGLFENDAEWDQKKGKTVRQLVAEDPEVKKLKDNLDDHFLIKDAMSQPAWNDDGTLGPSTIGENARYGESHNEFVGRMLQTKFGGASKNSEAAMDDNSDYSKRINVLQRDEKGRVLRDEDNNRAISQSVLVSKQEAEKLHAEEWQAFAEAAYPEVIVSNKALRSILAQGEFKSYTEANRPARAGANDAQYKNARAAYESIAFGYDNSVDVANRPISGMLTAFTPHSDLLKAYGGTQVVLKPSVLERTTVTYDDSLNSFLQPKSVADFLAKPAAAYRNQSVAADVLVNGKGYYTNRKRGLYNTPEIQVHGKVTTDDIAKVIFRSEAPEALANKLNKMDIPFEVIKLKDDV